MSNWYQAMPTSTAYWIDKVLFELHHKPDDLEHYRRDADSYLSRFQLTTEMKTAITTNDVAALYLSGVNPYLLRAHCIGMRIPENVSLAALRSINQEKKNG